jgi:hypothetical protein
MPGKISQQTFFESGVFLKNVIFNVLLMIMFMYFMFLSSKSLGHPTPSFHSAME